MNSQQIKAKILEDIAAAKKQGFTLVSGDWGDSDMKCACPLGCVNVALGTEPSAEGEGGVMKVLEVDESWIASFIDGYDSNGEARGATVANAWQMGFEIRQEFHPIDMGDFMSKLDSI